MKKGKTKIQNEKIHTVRVPHVRYGFRNMTDLAAFLRLMDKAIPLELCRELPGLHWRESSDRDRNIEVNTSQKLVITPPEEDDCLALPERGTHPALYDPKLA